MNKIISILILSLLLSCQNQMGVNSGSRAVAQDSSQDASGEVFEHRIESNVDPKRSIEELAVEFKSEKVAKLSQAQVLIADYDLLKKDFPALKEMSNPEIDRWLIDQVGYVSLPQTAQTEVNTEIPVEAESMQREAYRPRRYNRALIYDAMEPNAPEGSTQSMGLLDVKGSGSLTPAQKDHGNGVATLGEAIREFIYERMMREVVYDAKIDNKIVGSYAVIDPGFDVVHEDGSRSAAGFYVRQGHDRWVSDNIHKNDWLPQQDRTKLEKIFKRYGIDPNTNIQGTKRKDIFDFGHYVVRKKMPEIDSDRQLNFSMWGYDESIKEDTSDRWFYSKRDHPWNWSHELADSWRRGEADRHNVWQHYENFVRPFVKRIDELNPKNSSCVDSLGDILSN